MMRSLKISVLLLLVVSLALSCKQATDSDSTTVTEGPVSENLKDPLPSWNEGQAKQAILSYVDGVTKPGSPSFVPKEDRIATFDNDGTLWSEQPAYFQLFFALDQLKEMASDHPEWKTEEPFRSALSGDMEALGEQGLEGLLKIVMVTHAGMESEEFTNLVKEWVSTAKHPTKKVAYTQLVYQPMLELLNCLRQHEFKVYIVSGGGTDFMRAFAAEVYGVPNEQVIGSRIATSFEIKDGVPGIYRQPKLDFIDDKEGKPINIQRIIGKKPIFAGGNSDGDLAMLQWTSSNDYANFPLYVHHTDSIREWAYDRGSHIGGLDKGLEEAAQKGWTVIDMAKDWNVIYPFEMDGN